MNKPETSAPAAAPSLVTPFQQSVLAIVKPSPGPFRGPKKEWDPAVHPLRLSTDSKDYALGG